MTKTGTTRTLGPRSTNSSKSVLTELSWLLALLAILLQLPDGLLLQHIDEDVVVIVKEILLQGLHLVYLAAVEVLVIFVLL